MATDREESVEYIYREVTSTITPQWDQGDDLATAPVAVTVYVHHPKHQGEAFLKAGDFKSIGDAVDAGKLLAENRIDYILV